MIQRLRILAFSFFPAFVPPSNGGVERLYNFYAALSRHHDVTLLSSAFLGGEREVVRHLPSFTEIRVPKDAHFAAAFEELSKSKSEGDVSGPALGNSCANFGALHDEYLACYPNIDLIIHDSPFLIDCDIFRGFDNKFRVYNSYNCETELYSDFHYAEGQPNVIGDLVRDLEAEICRHCDLITVCSDEDAATMARYFAPSAPILRVPNGFTPGPSLGVEARASRKVVFLGSAHKPNLDTARLIVDEIAPKLRDIEFHLIGSCYPKGRARNIIAHGVISQLEKDKLLSHASAAINPMKSGGGSSLKIADIASKGCALLSTELGARGFGIEPNVHYIALAADQATAKIREALDDPALLARVAATARTHFEAHYSWTQIVANFVEHLGALMSSRPVTPKGKLVLNDYDSLASLGGGATRTQGLCRGLAETSPIIFLAFANDEVARRRVSGDGRILSLLVDKSPQHSAEHKLHNGLHWISTADIVNYQHAPQNKRMMSLFRCAASNSDAIVCEHPYMVGLPRAFGVDFVYSSQNFEAELKAKGLRDHPLREQLLPLVREAEAFACAASQFIVAVSNTDAEDFAATYACTAPIMVIANGADGPSMEEGRPWPDAAASERSVAVFMGSMHGPNVEAAGWVVTELAEVMPHFDFTLVGSIAASLEGPLPGNVEALGEVSARDKSRHLWAAKVALNPMLSGSGSNVKLADYLQHGLPVLTTAFGARGYEWVPGDDMIVADLADFKRELEALTRSELTSEQARRDRQARYASALSMDAGGRRLAGLIGAHGGPRKRALYVTYRYHDPALGGGEEYVVRLIHALAASGWHVDVVSPSGSKIVDENRFATSFSGSDLHPVPVGHPRVRSRKFPITRRRTPASTLRHVWNYQADFEQQVARGMEPPSMSCLAWGWADPEAGGRWSFRTAGLWVAGGGRLTLRARAIAPSWLQIFSDDGRRLLDIEAQDDIEVNCDVPAGFVHLRVSVPDINAIPDPRPLAMFVTEIAVGTRSLIHERISDVWTDANSAADRMAALATARSLVRDPRELEISPLRAPSDQLDAYVRSHVADFDLLITHNAVFKSTTSAISSAKATGVPSVLLPHLHYDDDFYHFRDVMTACASASQTLVSPRLVEQLMVREGYDNVVYHSPGVDLSTEFTPEDAQLFRDALPRSVDDFFLVLGRKAAAKGYRDIINAVDDGLANPAAVIVMIGPDDDGLPVEHPRVVYLGRQSDAVVRGALRECLGLINMSRSESFGMVLLEAGLASKPVLANRNCAAFADIVEDGVNGFLVTRAELPARMLALQADRDLRDRLGQAGRARAQDFGWTNIQAEFVQICDRLVKTGL